MRHTLHHCPDLEIVIHLESQLRVSLLILLQHRRASAFYEIMVHRLQNNAMLHDLGAQAVDSALHV